MLTAIWGAAHTLKRTRILHRHLNTGQNHDCQNCGLNFERLTHTSTEEIDGDGHNQADDNPDRVIDLISPDPKIDKHRGSTQFTWMRQKSINLEFEVSNWSGPGL